MTKIVWHCGFQKTGTTSIQSMLVNNADVLSEYVNIFPRHNYTRDLRKATLEFWNSGSDEDQADVVSAVRSITSSIEYGDAPVALVSDENILGKNTYSSWNSIVTFAQKVLPVIATAAAPHESEFVFYTRDMEAWLKSSHNQEVTAIRLKEGFDEWYANLPFEKDWKAIYDGIKGDNELNITFRDMTLDEKEGNVFGGFLLERCGIPKKVQKKLIPAPIENTSLPQTAIDFMLQVNNLWMNHRDIKRVRQLVTGNRHLFAENEER